MQSLFDPTKFGRRVAKAIDKSGLSLRRAAAIMDVDPATLCRTANGGAPSVETYLRIVRWLERQERAIVKALGDGT